MGWGTRLAWVLAVIGVVAVLLVIATWVLTDGFDGAAEPDRALQVHFNFLFDAAGPGEVVDLDSATTFEWDAVGVFGPYYPRKDIIADMGIDVPTSVTNWTDFEGNCLLVFRGGNEMVAWTLVERSVAECDGKLSGRVHPRADARFRGDAFRPAGG